MVFHRISCLDRPLEVTLEALREESREQEATSPSRASIWRSTERSVGGKPMALGRTSILMLTLGLSSSPPSRKGCTS